MNTDVEREFRAVAVQPRWTVGDFASERTFRGWLDRNVDLARPHLSGDRPNLLVLTELNGLPLLLAGAGLARRARSLEAGLALVVLKHLPAVLYVMLRERVSAPRALMLVLAPDVAGVYLRACRDVARAHGVYLASGSAALPHFELRGRRAHPAGRDVFNQTLLFDPAGRLLGSADKVHLTEPEGEKGLDLSAGPLRELRVYPTPVGDLGVAISLDAFREDVLTQLEAGGCTVMLQPDANGSAWTGPEAGPSGLDQPLVWLDSAWAAAQRGRGIRYVVNPMVVGNLLGVPFDGQSAITAHENEAAEKRGYVMTEPRGGFLALLEWVHDGTHDELREVGVQLAARGGARENAYREGAVSADLRLPPTRVPQPELRPHERALRAVLDGGAHLAPRPEVAFLRAAWPAACLGVAAWGAREARRGRPWGALALVAVAVGAAAALA